MPVATFFSSENLDKDSVIQLDEETSKHIVQVLRMKKGEGIRLTDGKGGLASAEIEDDHKKKVFVRIINIDREERSPMKTCIAISLLKNTSRFEWFLEKTTEIGITSIIPLVCERTEKQHFRYERMKNILVSAMVQSQQTWIPELSAPQKFISVVEQAEEEKKFIAHCIYDQKKELRSEIQRKPSSIILIGPEGDFTKNEIELALKNNFIPVSLGKNRLRTETAGIVAATYLAWSEPLSDTLSSR